MSAPARPPADGEPPFATFVRVTIAAFPETRGRGHRGAARYDIQVDEALAGQAQRLLDPITQGM